VPAEQNRNPNPRCKVARHRAVFVKLNYNFKTKAKSKALQHRSKILLAAQTFFFRLDDKARLASLVLFAKAFGLKVGKVLPFRTSFAARIESEIETVWSNLRISIIRL
jgi:hypothetical protein